MAIKRIKVYMMYADLYQTAEFVIEEKRVSLLREIFFKVSNELGYAVTGLSNFDVQVFERHYDAPEWPLHDITLTMVKQAKELFDSFEENLAKNAD